MANDFLDELTTRPAAKANDAPAPANDFLREVTGAAKPKPAEAPPFAFDPLTALKLLTAPFMPGTAAVIGKSPRQLGDMARYVVQEGLAGYGDEAWAGVQSLIEPYSDKVDKATGLPPTSPIPNYAANLADMRARTKRYEQEFPTEALATGAVAGSLPFLPLAAVTGPANLGARAGVQGALGAIAGAIHGFGSGEDGADPRTQRALHEAAITGVLSSVFPPAAALARGTASLISPLLGASGAGRAAGRIAGSGLRPLETTTAAKPDPFPEFQASPAQKLEDPRLLALEEQLLPADELATRRVRQGQAIQAKAGDLDAGPRLIQAEMDLETARQLVQPSLAGDTQGLASTRLHQGLTDLRDAARRDISTAFDKLDMPNVELPTQPLKENFKGMIDSFSALAGEKDVLPAKLLKTIDELGPNASMEEMQRLRSRLLSDARNEDMGSFERRVYNRAAGEVLEAMEAGLEKLGPGSEILKRQYAKARDLTRQMKQTFDNERVGHLFEEGASPSTTGSELLKGKDVREQFQALRAMAANNPRIDRATRDWLAHDLQAAVGTKEGPQAQRAIDSWLNKNKELFEMDPSLGDGFRKLADTHRMATDLGRRQALVEAIQAGEDPVRLIKKYGPDLGRLFPGVGEKDLVEAIRSAGTMLKTRGDPRLKSQAITDLQSEHAFMGPLTDDAYGMLGHLATLGPFGRKLWQGPRDKVLDQLRERLLSGTPDSFLRLPRPVKAEPPSLFPVSSGLAPVYDRARGPE